MTKVQRLYVGGAPAGGFRFTDKGKNVSTANQRVRNTPERSREDRQKDVGKIMKEMRENKDFKEKRKEFESKKENQNENRQQQEVKGAQTTEFLDDLKDAYKAGLFTGGTKTKAFMDKYGLTGTDIAKLRTGIDQGLGTRIGKGGNVLSDLVGDLRAEGILRNFGTPSGKVFKTAQDVFEPGMSRFDKLPIYENPEGIFQTAANMTYQYNPILRGFDLLAGGSSQGMRGLYYGREKLGLEGEELNNFAAAVANDRDLYNQMMATPEMQQYELNEFRAEANRNMIANRSDPDPISGTQPGAGGGDDSGGSDDGTTDPGSSYTPALQNTYTFFDPNLGRYRSGTYDEYLQYVTAKDGGIIQLSKGGNDEDPIAENKKVNLRNILAFIRENKDLRKELENMTTETDDQKLVKSKSQKLLDEENKTLADMLKERFTDQEHITELSVQSGDAVKMAEEDQPARNLLKNLTDRFGLPRTRPPEEEAPRIIEVYVENPDGTLRIIAVPMNQDTLQKLRDGTYQMTNRSSLDTGIFISPITDRRPVNPDTNDRIDDMIRDQYMNQLYQQALDYEMQKERDGGTTIRDPQTNQITAFNVANGGIIGLKDGGMDDMMQADSLMFRDPSDEGQWEYNV